MVTGAGAAGAIVEQLGKRVIFWERHPISACGEYQLFLNPCFDSVFSLPILCKISVVIIFFFEIKNEEFFSNEKYDLQTETREGVKWKH